MYRRNEGIAFPWLREVAVAVVASVGVLVVFPLSALYLLIIRIKS